MKSASPDSSSAFIVSVRRMPPTATRRVSTALRSSRTQPAKYASPAGRESSRWKSRSRAARDRSTATYCLAESVAATITPQDTS
ncbi:MAG: hypothetical protein ACXVRM_13540, partial [Solirubrobacteraceae bacterium]